MAALERASTLRGVRPGAGHGKGGEPDSALSEGKIAEDLGIPARRLADAAAPGLTSIRSMDGNRYTLELLARLEAEGALSCRVRVPFHRRNFRTLANLVVRSGDLKASGAPEIGGLTIRPSLCDGVVTFGAEALEN